MVNEFHIENRLDGDPRRGTKGQGTRKMGRIIYNIRKTKKYQQTDHK